MGNNKLSVAYEQREAFKIFDAAIIKYMPNNKRIYRKNLKSVKNTINEPLKLLAINKLKSLFGDDYINKIPIEFEFFTLTSGGNSGGTEFIFDEEPELKFLVSFNKHLRELYKKDIREFCLTFGDIFTHELTHCIQYVKQYKSIGIDENALKESIFKNKEDLLKLDIRYTTLNQYYEDLPYFSKHEELICYAKDAARQLLTVYKDKKIIFDKLSITSKLEELSQSSDCFYYYYDCFYNKIPGLPQYKFLWHRFIKQLCHNLTEDFTI